MEVWKKIPNFSRYEASNLGNIRSNRYKNSSRVIVLKPSLAPDGYLKTMLQNDQKKYNSWTVHKWIALAFLGEKPKGLEINHISGIKTDNSIKNLEYVTRSRNISHAYEMNLIDPKRGSKNGMAKLTESDIKEIREYVKNFNGRYYGRKNLAKKYRVSEAHIKDIVNRRRNIWPHV